MSREKRTQGGSSNTNVKHPARRRFENACHALRCTTAHGTRNPHWLYRFDFEVSGVRTAAQDLAAHERGGSQPRTIRATTEQFDEMAVELLSLLLSNLQREILRRRPSNHPDDPPPPHALAKTLKTSCRVERPLNFRQPCVASPRKSARVSGLNRRWSCLISSVLATNHSVSPFLGLRSKAPHLDGRVRVATALPVVAPAETRSAGRACNMDTGKAGHVGYG